MFENWSLVTLMALQDTWQGFLIFIPNIIGAILILILGWMVALGVAKLVSEILLRLKFDKIFEKNNWKDVLRKADLDVSPSEFIGSICKWILIIVFLLAAVEILGFVQFAMFLRGIITWLPNLIVASAIFVVAVIFADILGKILRATVNRIGVKYSNFLGVFIKGAIYVFATLAILLQLGIARTMINTIMIGLVGMISLAFGLSFGLGGRDAAAKFIEDIKIKISER